MHCHLLGSYKSRRRDVLIPPNHCGQPPTGLQEEFEACEHLPECADAAALLQSEGVGCGRLGDM